MNQTSRCCHRLDPRTTNDELEGVEGPSTSKNMKYGEHACEEMPSTSEIVYAGTSQKQIPTNSLRFSASEKCNNFY
jgi:hypothetical protein